MDNIGVGDKVVCIDVSNSSVYKINKGCLTLGGIYIIKEIKPRGSVNSNGVYRMDCDFRVRIYNDRSEYNYYYSRRFITLSDYRARTINNILV